MPEMEREVPSLTPTPELPPAGGKVASLVWRAMQGGADAPPAPGAARRVRDDEIADGLPSLWDAVWQAANGEEPKLRQLPPMRARELLDGMRRSFVESIRTADQPVDVHEI